MADDDDDFVKIEDALLVSDGDVLTIEVAGHRYTVPMYEVSWANSVRRAGERGTFRMRRDFAERIGLTKSR